MAYNGKFGLTKIATNFRHVTKILALVLASYALIVMLLVVLVFDLYQFQTKEKPESTSSNVSMVILMHHVAGFVFSCLGYMYAFVAGTYGTTTFVYAKTGMFVHIFLFAVRVLLDVQTIPYREENYSN